MSLSQPAAAWGEKFESDQFICFWLLVPGVTLVALASWKPPYYFFFSTDPPPKSVASVAQQPGSAHTSPVANSHAANDFAACGSVRFPPYMRRLSC
jgi:hypothetical protein